MVGPTGFEPATPSTPRKCATKLRYGPIQIRKLTLLLIKPSDFTRGADQL